MTRPKPAAYTVSPLMAKLQGYRWVVHTTSPGSGEQIVDSLGGSERSSGCAAGRLLYPLLSV